MDLDIYMYVHAYMHTQTHWIITILNTTEMRQFLYKIRERERERERKRERERERGGNDEDGSHRERLQMKLKKRKLKEMYHEIMIELGTRRRGDKKQEMAVGVGKGDSLDMWHLH